MSKTKKLITFFVSTLVIFFGFILIRNIIYNTTYSHNLRQKTLDILTVKENPLEIYSSCDGNTFEPQCQNEECIESGMERKIFDIWKESFLKYNNIDEEYFNNHFLISNIDLRKTTPYRETEEPYVWWRIDYIYKNDWIMSRQSESTNFASYNNFTNLESLNNETIKQMLEDNMIKNYLNYSDTISYEELMEIARKNKIKGFDFCHIGFKGFTGEFLITGSRGINYMKNQIYYADVNLITGEVEKYQNVSIMTTE